MKKLLKRIFRRKLKALVIVRRGEFKPDSDHLASLKAYAEDNDAAIVIVREPDAIRILTLGQTDRLLVPKSMSQETMRLIAESKPGQILKIDEPVVAQ